MVSRRFPRQVYCSQLIRLRCWLIVIISWMTVHRCSPLYVRCESNEKKLQNSFVSSPTVVTAARASIPSSAPQTQVQSSDMAPLKDDNGLRGSTISFIVFASVMLFGVMIFLLIAYRQCCQLHYVQKNESEWYLEETGTLPNGNKEMNDSTSKDHNDDSSSYGAEKRQNVSLNSTEPDDEVIEFDYDDIEAAVYEPVMSLQAVVKDFPIQWCHNDNHSDDDDDDDNPWDAVQQDCFDDSWTRYQEYDEDEDDESDPEQYTGPIDIDSGESVSPAEALPSKLSQDTGTTQQQHQKCYKRQRGDLKSPSTAMKHCKKRTKTTRHTTTKQLRDEYFQEKQIVRAHRIKVLQSIPEVSEHDSTVSVMTSINRTRTSRPTVVKLGCAQDLSTSTSIVMGFNSHQPIV